MKNVLMWIALIAVLIAPLACLAGALWLMMSMHPGIGIGQAVLALLGVGVPLFFQMMVAHLARRAFKRRKGDASCAG